MHQSKTPKLVTMKELYLIIGCLFCSWISLIAQEVPQAFSYQAVARDATGAPISNASVQVEIAILAGGPNGNIVYAEQHQSTTNRFGLFERA